MFRHTRSNGIRRAVGSLVIAGGVVAGTLVAGTTSSQALTGAQVVLTGSADAGVGHASSGQPVIFNFNVKNVSSKPYNLNLIYTWKNVTVVSVLCVLPNHSEINPDGSDCEPGFIPPQAIDQSAIVVRVPNNAPLHSTISVTACANQFPVASICKTVAIPIN